MFCTRKVNDDYTWVGADGRRLAMFEGVYDVPRGISFNSYLLMDGKTVLFDTADASVCRSFLENVAHGLGGRALDYLVVQHMEPDHAANVANFLKVYPETTIVANAKTFTMIQNFFGLDLEGQKLEVTNGGTLNLGNHNLTFVFAPMVHWPEVMVTYESSEKILFSADGFGKFGALDYEDPEGWACEARRYYFNIVGKYGAPVQALLKKAVGLDIRTICPLHGPVLNENLGYYLSLIHI